MNRAVFIACLILLLGSNAFAGNTGILPFTRPLALLINEFTDNIAPLVALLALMFCLWEVLRQHSLSGFGWSAALIFLVCGFCVYAKPILTTAFGVTAGII
jgi:hypothetical protein